MNEIDTTHLNSDEHSLYRAIVERIDAGGVTHKFLNQLIESLKPEVKIPTKFDITKLSIHVDGDAQHSTEKVQISSPGAIPDVLSELTEIIIGVHRANGDLGYLKDRIHDEVRNPQPITRVEKPEPKHFIVSRFDNFGDRASCLIGPFDTRGDAENYAIVQELAGVIYAENRPVECDDDGNWV